MKVEEKRICVAVSSQRSGVIISNKTLLFISIFCQFSLYVERLRPEGLRSYKKHPIEMMNQIRVLKHVRKNYAVKASVNMAV